MAQFYFNPARANNPHALPDAETFYHQHMKRELCALNAGRMAERGGECVLDSDGDCCGTGWYWQACFPGCLPDGEPSGPFATEAEAIADAQSYDDLDGTGKCSKCGEPCDDGEGWDGLCGNCADAQENAEGEVQS